MSTAQGRSKVRAGCDTYRCVSQVGILSWTAYNIILSQNYLMAETPAGIVSCTVTNDINLTNAITTQMQVGFCRGVLCDAFKPPPGPVLPCPRRAWTLYTWKERLMWATLPTCVRLWLVHVLSWGPCLSSTVVLGGGGRLLSARCAHTGGCRRHRDHMLGSLAGRFFSPTLHHLSSDAVSVAESVLSRGFQLSW